MVMFLHDSLSLSIPSYFETLIILYLTFFLTLCRIKEARKAMFREEEDQVLR